MRKKSNARESAFQTIPVRRNEIDYLHPGATITCELKSPSALDHELLSLTADLTQRIGSGVLDEEAVTLIGRLTSDVEELALAETRLEDIRRQRTMLAKRAADAHRETIDRLMLESLHGLAADDLKTLSQT